MIQFVDTNIITAHIARLEAEAASHRERSTAGQGPLSDPVFTGFWNIAEGGVKALKAVLAEAEAQVTDTPATADHITDGPCWCDPETITVADARCAS